MMELTVNDVDIRGYFFGNFYQKTKEDPLL